MELLSPVSLTICKVLSLTILNFNVFTVGGTAIVLGA